MAHLLGTMRSSCKCHARICSSYFLMTYVYSFKIEFEHVGYLGDLLVGEAFMVCNVQSIVSQRRV